MLEFALASPDAARLGRLRGLGRLKLRRSRPARCAIVWHDSVDDGLAKQAIALAESGGTWQLVQEAPQGTWPGQPPAILAEAAALEELGHPLPSPLLPLAAFEGKRRLLVLEPAHAAEAAPEEDGAVSVTLIDGTLRTLTEERPIARAVLDGPTAAVRTVALELAAAFDLALPRASLAAEARALARAQPPPPRRLGAPDLPPGLTVEAAFLHILAHLTEVLVHWAPLVIALAPSGAPEPVHQMRVALRRLRSAFSVFKPVLACAEIDAVRAGLKRLAGLLGPARDWDVFLGGLGQEIGEVFAETPAMTALLEAARRRRAAHYGLLTAHLGGPEFRGLGIALAFLPRTLPWRADAPETRHAVLEAPAEHFAGRVLNRRRRRLLRDGAEMTTMPIEALHALRLDGKRLRYASEFFAPLFPGGHARRFIRRLVDLQEVLGSLNDGAVAAALMRELGRARGSETDRGHAQGLVIGFAAARAAAARADGERAFDRWRRTQPFWA